MKYLLTVLAVLMASATAQAHDTWVQTNTNLLHVGDAVCVDLMLGNHGNEGRDFKLMGKADLSASTLQIVDPQGRSTDLKSRLTDTGAMPQEGFWTARFTATQPGLYIVANTFDKVMSYAPVRDIKSAKAFFVASRSLDHVSLRQPGFGRVLGHPLELVPETNPVIPMKPGVSFKVRLLYRGKPLPNVKVSFIPRGETLKAGFNERYEQKTDGAGRVQFITASANDYMIAARWDEPTEKGKGYNATEYSATIALYVPQICPCDG